MAELIEWRGSLMCLKFQQSLDILDFGLWLYGLHAGNCLSLPYKIHLYRWSWVEGGRSSLHSVWLTLRDSLVAIGWMERTSLTRGWQKSSSWVMPPTSGTAMTSWHSTLPALTTSWVSADPYLRIMGLVIRETLVMHTRAEWKRERVVKKVMERYEGTFSSTILQSASIYHEHS